MATTRKSAKMTEPERKHAKPSKLTAALAREICARLSLGVPLAVICREAHMPSAACVWRRAKEDESFAQELACAREAGFDQLAAQCLEIADDERHDWTLGQKGEVTNTVAITRAKLQIDTRLKLLTKWDPKRYGDKIDVNAQHSGELTIVIGGNV